MFFGNERYKNEYVNKAALMDKLMADCNPDKINNATAKDVFTCAVASVEVAPAASVMPIVEATWRADGTCSNCNGVNPTYRENKWASQFPELKGNFEHLNYCPHCAAKMDGGMKNA